MEKTALTVMILGFCLASWTFNSSKADDDASLSVKEIMIRAHKGGDCVLMTVGKGLRANDPQWETLQKKTGELVKLANGLAKNDPPHGEKSSWVTFSKRYLDNATALDAAVKNKERDNAVKAQKKLTTTCELPAIEFTGPVDFLPNLWQDHTH